MNYPKYTKNLDPDAHVRVFKQTIKINNVTKEGTKITYFQLMLQDTTLAWGDDFVNIHFQRICSSILWKISQSSNG
jgi:hypothetical protein